MPSLSTLREKLGKRERRRRRQARLWRQTRKAGHGKAARRHTRAIRKLKRLIRDWLTRHPRSGTGIWGGCRSIINNEVVPVAERQEIPITSRKRSANDPLTIANPGSDHSVLSRESDAIDLGTYGGEGLAHEIADALGISGYTTGNYTNHYISRAGRTFRVQILWAVEGHFDHVHVGIRREG